MWAVQYSEESNLYVCLVYLRSREYWLLDRLAEHKKTCELSRPIERGNSQSSQVLTGCNRSYPLKKIMSYSTKNGVAQPENQERNRIPEAFARVKPSASFRRQTPLFNGSGAVCSMDLYEDEPNDDYEPYAMRQRMQRHGGQLMMTTQATTKVPPGLDGKTSWFVFEDVLDEWCDTTELESEKWGPAPRNRLEGVKFIHTKIPWNLENLNSTRNPQVR